MTLNLRPGLRTVLFSAKRFTPLALPNLALWLDATVGLTLSTTPYAGTGTVTQVGTALTGVGTSFLGEVKVGDALSGTLISGNVVSIASATALTLDASNSGAGAAFTITPVAGVSDRVTTWADQSGNGRNATQATAKLKPSKKPNAQNGLPMVRGDGIDDDLDIAAFNLLTGFTILAVVKTSDANGQTIGKAEEGVTYGEWALGIFAGKARAEVGGSAGTNKVVSSVASANDGVAHLIGALWDGALLYARLDGVSASIAATSNVANASAVKVFSRLGSYQASDIGEIVVCSSYLSAGNLALLEAYERAKWATP